MADHQIDILLQARDQASKQIKGVNRELSILGRTSRGIKTATGNLLKLGAAGAAVGVGAGILAIKSGLDSLAERENVVSATAAAIAATGNKAKVSAGEIRAWSEAIETATGAAVDDKAIQAGANALLRFGAVSGDVFKRALTDATDLGAGMKTGPEAAAKLLGKALADPAKAYGALKKAGIVLTKAEQDRIKVRIKANKLNQAQDVILQAVERRYKGAAAASAGPYTRALNMLADASEDAKMALATGFLPVIQRVADWLQNKLADPATLTFLRQVGDNLADAASAGLDFLEGVDWKGLGDGLRVAADWAGRLFGAFMSMPPEVKGTILALAGLNKLSGGAVSGIVVELGKGLIKGVLGMTAGVVNINAGVVNGGGAPGAGAVGAGAGTKGPMSLLGTAAAGLSGGALIVGIQTAISDGYKALNPWNNQQLTDAIANAPKDFWTPGLNAIMNLDKIPGALQNELAGIGDAIRGVKPAVPVSTPRGTIENDPTGFKNSSSGLAILKTLGDTHSEQIATTQGVLEGNRRQGEALVAFRAGERTTATTGAATASAARTAGTTSALATLGGSGRIVAAIYAARPVMTTNVYVSVPGASVRYGSRTGSAGRSDNSRGGP